MLGAALGRLFAVAEAYPQLRASENFMQLQEELTDTEDKIAAARRYYNATVLRFNTRQQTFPTLIVARLFRFSPREFFEAGEDAEAPVGVAFGSLMTLQQQIRANRWRTIWLLFLFSVLVVGLGVLLAFVFDPTILTFVAIGGIVYAIVSWFASSSMVAGMTGAQKIEKRDNPYLYRLLENVSIAAGLEQTPELRLVQDDAPNAFAAGRSPKHAFVAVTTGLVDLMDERELEGVLAHEVAHIRNRDVRLMTLVALLVGVIALLADILLRVAFYGGGKRSNPIITIVAFGALLLAPVAGIVIQLALSRRREYLADASAAEITNDAEGMALALRRLQLDQTEIRNASRATAHMYIESPLRQASAAPGRASAGSSRPIRRSRSASPRSRRPAASSSRPSSGARRARPRSTRPRGGPCGGSRGGGGDPPGGAPPARGSPGRGRAGR